MEFGLLGEKLGHSFSPQIHRALAGYDYQLLPTPPEAVEDLFRRRPFRGLNVTIPYKRTVMDLCDEVDPRARAIGAVNTVVNRAGRLTGYNTDLDGLMYLARRTGVDMAGKKVVVLGSGGTSHTACAAARELGAAQVITPAPRSSSTPPLWGCTPITALRRCPWTPFPSSPACWTWCSTLCAPPSSWRRRSGGSPAPAGWPCWWPRPGGPRSCSPAAPSPTGAPRRCCGS